MNTNKTISDHMMAPLVQKYLQRLQERDLEVKALLEHAERDGLTAAGREQLRHYAHNLAGSGATYGYPEISSAGLALEEALDGGAGPGKFMPLAKTLLDAVHTAIAVADSSRLATGQVETAIAERPANQEKLGHRKKKLLVIDDDMGTGKLMAELFKDEADVISAYDGENGLVQMRAHKPDLVLLDIDMPGINGNAALRRIQQDPELQKIPVVMLTAYRRGRDVVQSMMGGAIGYVAKPFKIDDLVSKVRTLFAHFDTTVLIADDDESIRDLLFHKFRSTGVRVLTALDGEEAFAMANQHTPQLAILDWMMPGLDGLALLRKMKRNAATMKTKVVMLTAKHQEQDVLDGFKLGAGDYIVKPFIAEEVVVRCMRLLGLSQAAEE